MNEEYERLEAEASAVELQVQKLGETTVTTAGEHVLMEQQLDKLHVKLRSLRHGMILIRSVNSGKMQNHVRTFVERLPHRFHSQGCRKKSRASRWRHRNALSHILPSQF